DEERFDAVVLATPAYAAAELLARVDRELAELLSGIEYAPMRVAGIAFRKAGVAALLDGFGFLAARDQGVRILGALYTSSLFPDHAPEDMVYLRAFAGGTLDPNALDCDDGAMREIVLTDLERVLGIDAPVQQWHEVT